MEYKESDLKELHKVLSEMTNYIAQVCKDNKLTYFLYGGSALGAYRHNGFIPWDDDVDVILPRDDYNKLLSILRNKKDPKYSIQNEVEEENYYLPYSKLRKNGTVFREQDVPDVYKNEGIFVDIFPLDKIQDPKSASTNFRIFQIKMLNHILCFRMCRNYYKKKLSAKTYTFFSMLNIIMKPYSNRQLLRKEHSLMSEDDSKECRYVFNLRGGTARRRDDIMPRSYYFPPRQIMFEGTLHNVPGKVEKYLTLLYGDTYMQLPPENERRSHSPILLKF